MNETYDKLLGLADAFIDPWMDRILDDPVYNPDNRVAKALLDAIWPEVVELLAKIGEYEHALEHVTDPHVNTIPFMPPQPVCSDCQRLARSALDGVNRADFREQVNEAEMDD